MDRTRLGIDIGGSGVKGAPVNPQKGELVAERLRLPTPQPSSPNAVAATVAEVVRHFEWHGPVGATMPAVVKMGVVLTAANIDEKWIGTNAAALFSETTGCPVRVINDADAAGIAEMRFGAGKGRDGVVVMITLGTGIGCAVFNDGVLVPNTELGHIEMNGADAEDQASARVRDETGESWKKWGGKVNQYLQHLDALLWPDLIIIGGGVSKKADKFFPFLHLRAEVVPAMFENEAGIVGAALLVSGRESYPSARG
jgi:polyphosphate glucokinase